MRDIGQWTQARGPRHRCCERSLQITCVSNLQPEAFCSLATLLSQAQRAVLDHRGSWGCGATHGPTTGSSGACALAPRCRHAPSWPWQGRRRWHALWVLTGLEAGQLAAHPSPHGALASSQAGSQGPLWRPAGGQEHLERRRAVRRSLRESAACNLAFAGARKAPAYGQGGRNALDGGVTTLSRCNLNVLP